MSEKHVAAELAALQGAIDGEVILPGSAAYEKARKPVWAQYAHIRPAAIVRCNTPADVAEAVACAREAGLAIAVRSGGHCFAGRSSTEGILIDVGPMRSVSVADGIATIGAGALLGDVYDALDVLGLAIAAGACPTVGIAGLTLGGGLGILGRKHGLTSDQLLGAQVVLADGRVVDCDEHQHAELFWALRGAGGGRLGVVTSFGFTTVPADDLTCFKLSWPFTHAEAAIEAWQDWSPDARDELAASLLVNAGGDGDGPVVTLFGAMVGPAGETTATLDGLIKRLGAEPASTLLEQMSHRAAKRFLAEQAPGAEGEDIVPPGEASLMFSKSEFFRRRLPKEAVAALVNAFTADRATAQARELDFTPWGGAYNRTSAEATAFVHRSERFLLKHAVTLDADASTGERDAARDWLATSWSRVRQWGSGGVFPNFPDADLAEWATAYHGANSERLARIKARYDPDNLFRYS
jgi:FAD/FMN-containing dehydrogenase